MRRRSVNSAHVWIGVAPRSGKSSIGAIVGAKLGMPVYHADDRFDGHAAQVAAGPVLRRIASSSLTEIFDRPVEIALADFIEASYEEFPLILEDLERPEWSAGAVVEGCALLPSCVARLAPDLSVVYIVPTEDFQRRQYALRPWVAERLRESADPDKVWESWRLRDAAFARFVISEAESAGFPVVVVNGTLPLGEVARLVQAHISRGKSES